MAFGLVMIYSASSYTAQLQYGDASYYMMRQFKIAMGGLLIALVISKLDYHWYARFALAAYVLSYVLMIAVALMGKDSHGSRRWLNIGGITFQPTEFVKIVLIVLLATVVTQMGKKINSPRAVGLVVLITVPIAGLVAANNLSSGIIIMGIGFFMLFVACRKSWPFFLCGFAAAGAMAVAGPLAKALEMMKLLKPYQLERIYVWLDPEAYPMDGGFQVLQGLYAIGSGGLFGRGLGESVQKLGFVPEAQNDMIFSIICEELGLFGAGFVMILFLILIWRFFVIATHAEDLFGALIASGAMAHMMIQVILNIAVVTNTIPNTGITLPFVSYGGTSVVFLLLEMGLVLSVSSMVR